MNKLLFLLILTSTALHAAVETVTISREEYNSLVKSVNTWNGYLKKRLDKDEADLHALQSAKGSGSSETVDLNNLSTVDVTHGHGPSSGSSPMFKSYFDLDFINRPGLNNGRTDLTFDNYHAFLFFEIAPSPDIQFSFDINPSPHFFELDYQVAPKLQLRFGKIWIPFDDLSPQTPHNIFGGRANISKLALGANFLPDLWTELGVGAKYQLLDLTDLSLESYAYIVNGFGTGGQDPVNSTDPNGYPSLADVPIGPDNNRDKALGGRLHALIKRRLGLGVSYYTERWSNQEAQSLRLSILGFDGQYQVSNDTEFRAGIVAMPVTLAYDSFVRNGWYVEAGQKFGTLRQFKGLLRTGMVQLDNRVTAITDQRLLGATILYHPGLLEYSIEHSEDLDTVAGKPNYSYTAARVIMAF